MSKAMVLDFEDLITTYFRVVAAFKREAGSLRELLPHEFNDEGLKNQYLAVVEEFCWAMFLHASETRQVWREIEDNVLTDIVTKAFPWWDIHTRDDESYYFFIDVIQDLLLEYGHLIDNLYTGKTWEVVTCTRQKTRVIMRLEGDFRILDWYRIQREHKVKDIPS